MIDRAVKALVGLSTLCSCGILGERLVNFVETGVGRFWRGHGVPSHSTCPAYPFPSEFYSEHFTYDLELPKYFCEFSFAATRANVQSK